MTTLVNRFNAQPGKEAELLSTAKGWKDMILSNPDCSGFDVYTDQDAPGAVVLIEEWTSKDAHQAFMASIPEEMMAESMKLMTGMPEGTYLEQA